jgi:hypothetical protein
MKDRRSAGNAIWRHIRPRLEELGFEQDGFQMRRVRGGEISDTINGPVLWYSKHGALDPTAAVGSRAITELLARHGVGASPNPGDWRGLGAKFWQWGILEPERFYHGRGQFAFRAGADPEQVADTFWQFYVRVIEPRLQSVHTPGDILRLEDDEVGPYGMWEPTYAAAAHLSGDDARARAILEMCMSGYAVAKEHGYGGLAPEDPRWPIACSLLRALGGDPNALPAVPRPDWPRKDERFIAKVREGRRPPDWLGYK